jgi:hypothetical protein
MKVRDLVQIEKVDEVIQIGEHKPEQIVATFVADERLEQQIVPLLERFLQRGEKNSFFIIGSYGSGKSHLLAFLGDLLSNPELWNMVKSEKIRSYAPYFREKKFATIWIPLPTVKTDLRDYIWREMEKQLSEIAGIPVFLAPGEYIRTAESDPRFFLFLREFWGEENSKERWEYTKSKNPYEALEIARDFFDGIGVIPKIGEEVESVMERALQILEEKSGERVGIILVIDELFDFLRAKGEGSASFARDIGFLRELGEASRNYDFFVLASLQEDIFDPAKVGAERDNINRISQRFEKLTIPYLNLQKVARERVLKKNNEQVEQLRKLYSSLRNDYFPNLQFDETSFVDLYPVHPFVLRIYEKIVREVGPRSLLIFLSQSALKIQDEPYDTLITLSELYDALEGELRVSVSFASYIRDVVPYFQANIPRWFEDKDVANWMEKAVKALVILGIAKEKATCKQLAELILYRRMEEFTYQEFAHQMENLYKGSSYLYLEEGTGVDAIYVLRTEGVDIEKLIEREVAKINDDEPALWEIARESLEEEYGAPKGVEQSGCSYRVDWRNTERKGWVRFVGEVDTTIIEEVNSALKEDGELDFYLLVLRPNLPHQYLPEKEFTEEKILLWRPFHLGAEELNLLKRRLAISRLLQTDLDEAVRRRLRDKSTEASEKVNDLVEEIYFKKGALSFLQPPLPSKFDEAVEESVRKLLDELYPNHPYFPRKINRRMLRDSIRCLAELVPSSPTLTDYINQLSATDLIREEEGKYIVPEGRDLYKAILEKLKPKNIAKVSDVWETLRSKPYGLTGELVEFLILALVWKGIISVKGSTKEFFRQDLDELIGVNFVSKDYSRDYFLKLLAIIVSPEALELAKVILEEEVKADTAEQKSNLWGKLREVVGKYDVDKLESLFEGFHEPLNKALLLENLGTIRERIEKLSQVIKENPSPEEGFRMMNDLIKNRFEEYRNALVEFKKLSKIGELREMVNREIDYLQQISLPKGDSLLKDRDAFLLELVGDKIFDNRFLENWLSRVEFFKKGYIERYTALHEEIMGQRAKVWEELENLRRDPRLSCLERIWEIMGEAGASNPAWLIKERNEGMLRHRCLKLYKDSLQNTPFCPNCRLEPANPPKLEEEVERLRLELEREWNATIEELRGKEERLRKEFAKGTSMAREKLESLLKGEPIEFSEEVVELLKRGLGKVEIYEIDLRPYIRDGGIYKPSDLLERIKKAIGDIVKKGENIRIRIRLN